MISMFRIYFLSAMKESSKETLRYARGGCRPPPQRPRPGQPFLPLSTHHASKSRRARVFARPKLRGYFFTNTP